jgi:hypothetical protein
VQTGEIKIEDVQKEFEEYKATDAYKKWKKE